MIAFSPQIVHELELLGYSVTVTDKRYDSETLLCQHPTRRNMMVFVRYDGLILVHAVYTREIADEWAFSLHFRTWSQQNAWLTAWLLSHFSEGKVFIHVELPFHGYDREVFLEILERFEQEISEGISELERWKEIKK